MGCWLAIAMSDMSKVSIDGDGVSGRVERGEDRRLSRCFQMFLSVGEDLSGEVGDVL